MQLAAGPNAAEWMAAISTLVGTVFIFIGLIYAGLQVAQARRLRLDEARPFVLVRFRQGAHRLSRFTWLEVMNVGSIVACDVKLMFKPAVQIAMTDSGEFVARSVERGFKTLVPGAVMSTLFDFGPRRMERRNEGRPVPDEYEVTVTYRDRPGAEERR